MQFFRRVPMNARCPNASITAGGNEEKSGYYGIYRGKPLQLPNSLCKPLQILMFVPVARSPFYYFVEYQHVTDISGQKVVILFSEA